jgi:hypothetical protein
MVLPQRQDIEAAAENKKINLKLIQLSQLKNSFRMRF